MSDIVNLNKARKAKLKADKTRKAAENRIVFGISTKVRKVEIKKAIIEAKKLDQGLLNSKDGNKKS